MKFTKLLLILLCLGACDRRSAPEEVAQLDAFRQRYQAVLNRNFPQSLSSPAVDALVDDLLAFSGSKDGIAEARQLADQIRADRKRYGVARREARTAQEMLAGAQSSRPKAQGLRGRDETEQVWLNALRKGTSLAVFDRFWRPCFRRDREDKQLYHRTGIRPCMVRSHYERIQSVRFRRGQLAELIPRVPPEERDGGSAEPG